MLRTITKLAHCLPNSLTNISAKPNTKYTSPHKTKLSVYSLLVFSLLAASPGYVYAKNDDVKLPENATARSYGTGWNCDKGYREKNNGCAAILIPENAYSTNKTYGRGWECKRSFRKIDDTCILIKVPTNGYLDHSGKQLKCNRGYLINNDSCDAIDIPENGFLETSSYGPGWECERGYRAEKNKCIALELPANSHIDYSGNSWECDTPYLENNDQCTL